jgi:two-component system, NtrC family, response regulator HydG
MPLIADRFLSTDRPGDAIDLATDERVRLFVDVEVSRAAMAARTVVCDRLAGLRHPLLRPLVDYGAHGRGWFEAYACVPPATMGAGARRPAVLHLVRFLRAAGVELSAEMAARAVHTVAPSLGRAARPIGVFLRERPAIETVRTLLEADGPPGATAIDIVAGVDAGLYTFRLQVARLARLAGFLVLDASGGDAPWRPGLPRHLCALDWLPRGRVLPAVIGNAAAGGRRHVWIRFCRDVPGAPSADVAPPFLRLEPMMRDELTASIFPDPELGPTQAETRAAVDAAEGHPGAALALLSGSATTRSAGWVHERSPEYEAAPQAQGETVRPRGDAGLARLTRAVDAARGLIARGRPSRAARLLEQGAAALAARGAVEAAATAACDLGVLWLDRAQPQRAALAFAQAGGWTRDAATRLKAVIGGGQALFELDRLTDAEAAFRTAAAAHAPGAGVWLARTLWRRGDASAALAAAGDDCPAVRSRILLSAGRVEEAATAAREALALTEVTADGRCEAHVAAAYVHAAARDAEGVRRHMDEAMRAAADTRHPARRFEIAAERWTCLERCGVATPVKVRDRLLRVAARLPPRAGAVVRAALKHAAAPALTSPPASPDLVRHFQQLVDATHDGGDEAAALQQIAAVTLRRVGACSLVIRGARGNDAVAVAGRSWPGEPALATAVLNGGAAVRHDGVTPEAVVPVAVAGAVVGSLAVRWVTGAHPGWTLVEDVLRVTALAAAPLLRALARVETREPVEGGFPDDLFGRGEAAERLRQVIRRAASAPYPVLIEGESGSGKELVARAIHARGVRRARRFGAVNCAALTDDLLEAELFGHARGAFTGALTERAGLFEDADQGTLFLDEVGELSPRAQAKLLRVLQEGEVRRVGENLARKVDVRIVAASNRSLEHEVQAGRFRADLRFRLDVIRIGLPPLRERLEDIPWLAGRIWSEAAGRVGSRAVLGDDLVAALARYDWPGNVRELQNVIASLAVHAPRRGRVPPALLPSRIAQEAERAAVRYDQARAEFERRFLRAALARAGGRRSIAAEQIGLSRQRLMKILKRLQIE